MNSRVSRWPLLPRTSSTLWHPFDPVESHTAGVPLKTQDIGTECYQSIVIIQSYRNIHHKIKAQHQCPLLGSSTEQCRYTSQKYSSSPVPLQHMHSHNFYFCLHLMDFCNFATKYIVCCTQSEGLQEGSTSTRPVYPFFPYPVDWVSQTRRFVW